MQEILNLPKLVFQFSVIVIKSLFNIISAGNC